MTQPSFAKAAALLRRNNSTTSRLLGVCDLVGGRPEGDCQPFLSESSLLLYRRMTLFAGWTPSTPPHRQAVSVAAVAQWLRGLHGRRVASIGWSQMDPKVGILQSGWSPYSPPKSKPFMASRIFEEVSAHFLESTQARRNKQHSIFNSCSKPKSTKQVKSQIAATRCTSLRA